MQRRQLQASAGQHRQFIGGKVGLKSGADARTGPKYHEKTFTNNAG
jgi:hypothetical protein